MAEPTSATEAEWRERNGIDPDKRVVLMADWWWIGDIEGTGVPEYMIWAGGREMYDDAIRVAKQRWGVSPITVPLNAFFPPTQSGSTQP